MKEPYILIPALNPNRDLVEYIRKLIEKGFQHILVINDGSREDCNAIFHEIEAIKGCTVFRHAVNLGKGRALKNGFNFFLNLKDVSNYSGVITVDSDGQHSVDDVEKMAYSLEQHPESLILGCRNFSLEHVPKKSSFGNKITCRVLRLLYGIKLKDTQTGLRGFPTNIIPKFIQLFGERFEYETNMLIEVALKKIPVVEIDIQTIYIDNNSETHFRPLKDSWAIYSLIFKSFFFYMCSSIASFLIDIGLFQLFVTLLKWLSITTGYITLATFAARILSSLFNYTVNRTIVFKNSSNKNSLIKYYILCICQMLISAGVVTGLYQVFQIPEVLIKIVVDTILFCISYQIQQRWVFRKKNHKNR